MDFHFCADAWDVPRYACDVDSVSPIELATTTLAATQIVDALSGHQFGLCTQIIRPCRKSCAGDYVPWSPSLSTAVWPAQAYWPIGECGSCGTSCSCSSLSQVELPYPVHDVVTVKLDGTPLATGAYRVDSNRWLVRLDGGTWPRCNDLRYDDSQAGTWSVTARYGQDPPQIGKDAVGAMACELLKSFRGEDCSLPANVVSLVRQGVTIKYGDVTGAFEKGRTGIYLVDAFIEAVNPKKLKRRPRVFNVDEVVQRRVGT